MSFDADLAKIDALHHDEKVSECHALITALSKENGSNVEVQWRYARSLWMCGREQVTDATAREALYREANATIEASLTLPGGDTNGNALKWAGITLGTLGDFISTKEKIQNAFKIREFFDKAHAANPSDATVVHCIAKWCFKVASIGMIERGIATALFATPPSSSYAEAEEYARKAASINTDKTWAGNGLLLGEICYQQSKYGEAKAAFEAVTKGQALSAAHRAEIELAVEWIGKCAYYD